MAGKRGVDFRVGNVLEVVVVLADKLVTERGRY
jgi:hypothetical protein